MKRLLNQCADNSKTESDISAEEIKQAVMAKINGNAPEAEIENGEFVQPTFVNTRPKRKYALTAAAAVVCVGVGAAGIAVANGGIGNGDFSALTETTENTSETAEEYVWEEENAVMIPLLDGQVLYYDTVNDSVKGEYHREYNKIQFKVSQDDQLWFTVDDEKINITEAAGEKDYYVYTYINSGSGKEHQMVVANTTDPFYCGYVEIYRLGEHYCGEGDNCYIPVYTGNIKDLDDRFFEHYWFKAALYDLGFVDDSTEGKHFSLWSESCSNILPCDPYTFNLADGTQIKWFDGENRYYLDDGTKIIEKNDGARCWQENKVGLETDNVIKAENGRIYYTAYREKTDITGKTDSDTPYVRQYFNPLVDPPIFDPLPETCKHIEPIHYIIVGGTEEGGDLGYAELLSCNDKWYTSTYNAVIDGELRPWLRTALDALFDDLNADNFLEKCMYHNKAEIPMNEADTEVHLAQMVYMLDGSWEDGSQQSMPQWDIFEIEDGKLWFTGNGERIDVAEAAGDKDYFIYRYTPEGSIDERIVIGENTGEVDDVEEVGYLEIYSVYDMEHGVYTHYRGLGNKVYLWKENIEDGVEDIKPWVKNAFEELGLRLADNNVIAVNEVVIGRG